MPTSYTDQFYTIDPGVPPAVGTTLTPQAVTFVDNNDDGQIGTGAGDTFNGVSITSVWVNDTITVNVAGVGNVQITGVTFYLASGPAVFTPTDGAVLQNSTFVSSTFVTSSTQTPVGNFGPPCFTPGALVETPQGQRLIETLKQGDMVNTLDHGPQPLLWIGWQKARAVGVFAPVRFEVGAIGNTTPITVSQQHRMMISGWQAELYYGLPEVFVTAKHLVDGEAIRLCPGGTVEYIHLLFEQHEVILADGVPSESYYPVHALTNDDFGARHEIEALFPRAPCVTGNTWKAARPVLRRPEAMLLVA
ncbi:MAG: Hint domain-containing protein [Paracoccaceae bacterium]